MYIRLGRAGEAIVHDKRPKFSIGKGLIIKEGKDITIIATGNMLGIGLEVSKKLKNRGISVRLISMHTIKPFDSEIIIDSVKKTKAIFSLEEHSIIGGLGSAVSEVLAENNINTVFKRLGVSDRFTKEIGDQEYMRKVNGLSIGSIVEVILKSLNHA